MELYSILGDSSKNKSENVSFHLVQLPNDFLQDLKSDNNDNNDNNVLKKYDINEFNKFNFKSISENSTPFLTTNSKTFKIRQQNHSNCVMLLKDNINYKNFNNYLILEKQSDEDFKKNKLNLKDIEIIEMKSFIEFENFKNENNLNCFKIDDVQNIFTSFKKILNNTPISPIEFDNLILDYDFIPNFNNIIKINLNMETILLNLILNCTIDLIIDINNEINTQLIFKIIKNSYNKLIEKFKLSNNHLLIRVITFIILKYFKIIENNNDSEVVEIDQFLQFTIPNGNYKILHNKIIKFLTLSILTKENSILLDDLLIQIRLNLPLNYLPNFEINEILNGFSYTEKVENNQLKINYLTNEKLSIFKSPKERFSKLFNLKSQWDLNEIKPFIDPVNTKNIKIDKFCLKYCRVKRIKDKTILMKR